MTLSLWVLIPLTLLALFGAVVLLIAALLVASAWREDREPRDPYKPAPSALRVVNGTREDDR